MRIMITGATGYIGSRLTTLVINRGHEVVISSRIKPISLTVPWIHFDLSLNSPVVLPVKVDVVVHLAFGKVKTNFLDDSADVVATQRLISSARRVGAKFIYVSSQTARVDAPTCYGRTKWRIEQDVLASGGWVVRPGQVYGGELRGLYGTLVKIAQKTPLLPSFIPSPKVQPIHVDDLAEGLIQIAEREDIPSGVMCLASSEQISFTNSLREISRSRIRRKRFFLPVPVMLVNSISAIMGTKLRERLGLDRLYSLFNLPPMKTSSDMDQLGLILRPLSSGLHSSGDNTRRNLMQEGQALFVYILKKKPDNSVLRRYVRAVESLRNSKPLDLPQVFLDYPILLSLLVKSLWLDPRVGEEFSWRMDAATMLAEASPNGAARFLGNGKRLRLPHVIFSLITAILQETFWRVARFMSSPILRLVTAKAKVLK